MEAWYHASIKPGILVAVVTGNFLHEHHDPAPHGGIINSHDAPISLKPSELETKSSIWTIDNALPLEPCGADAFGAAAVVGVEAMPSKKNATGT
jgi:hypothetical protein